MIFMAQSSVLSGRSGKITINDGTEELIGSITDYNISVQAETDTISYMDAFENTSTDIPWASANSILVKKYSWTGNCNAKYVKHDIDNGYLGQKALRDKMAVNTTGATAAVKFYLSETDGVAWSGTALITSMDLKATPDGNIALSFTLTGLGSLSYEGV